MKALRDVWGTTLAELADDDERLVMLDADVANSTKADIFAQRHPDRFLQLGIAEQNMIGVAAGLALEGFVPWASSFSVFMTHRAIDPIRMLVAQTGANVKLAGAYSGLLTGLTGRTHQDVEDLAILRAMPGLTVLCPADPAECRSMVRWANDYVGPVYLRVARDPEPDLGEEVPFVPGAVRVLREGADVTLVSTGVQSVRVLAAADLLAETGIASKVVHVPSIKPLDESALRAELMDAPLIVTVEEHSIVGGLGGLVAEVTSVSGGFAAIHRIGLNDTWTESAPNDFLLDKYGLSATQVAADVRTALRARVAV